MSNKKSTKRALLSSVLSLVLCLTMLIGTTFAWFTDNVTSTGNIIKSGKLEAELNYKSKITDQWSDASKGAIFNYEKWEPGYVDVKYVQVANVGNLAFRYLLNIIPETLVADGEEDLADVIDVYVIKNPTVEIVRDDLSDATKMTKVGTLASLMADPDGVARGILLPKGGDKTAETLTVEEQAVTEVEQVTMGIALKMQESAGNEYQELSVGGGFKVELLATQYMYESDSFDDTYDSLADYDGEISNAKSLEAAFKAGGNYKIIKDFTIPKGTLPTVPQDKTVGLDLNGHSIVTENTSSEYAFNNLGNLTIWDSQAASTTYSLRATSTGSVSARGIYNGYDKDGNYVTTAKLTVLSGVYNAKGNGGGAAIFNYGIAEVKGGTFTSIDSYALNNRTGASMTVNNATVDGGIYNEGGLTIESSEVCTRRGGYSHAIYHAGTNLVINSGVFTGNGNEVINANNSPAVINGGTFKKVEKATYLIGGSKLIINDGYFYAHESNPAGHPVRPNVTINGGVFNYKPDNLSVGVTAIESNNGEWLVVNVAGRTEVSTGLYKDDNGAYFVYTGKALSALNAGWSGKTIVGKNTVVNIAANIDFDGYTWTPVDSHADGKFSIKEINGNGYTINNLTINGQAMFTRFAGTGDVTIKDITFDNATVNSTVINSSILTVQSYQNVLLDNVDVINSTITGGYKVAPLIATVYNESSSTVTATLKNCDVKNCIVKATSYDFCTTGMVAFVYASDNDKVEFENCTISDVTLMAPNDGYKAHAFVYTTGSESLYNEAEGVTVTNCTFEALK